MSRTVTGPDGKPRCNWCAAAPEFFAYHDQEWGYPVADDQRLFEKLCLESFQSGLSWRTILAKRENFRNAFHQFDFNRIARYTERDVNRLLQDEGIVRHRGKIEATIGNAKAYLDIMEEEGSFAKFLWGFVDGVPQQNAFKSRKEVPTQTDMSVKLSKELKRRGFKFCGPTIVYAFAQAVGMVNDHMVSCFRHQECAALAERR